LTLLVERQEGLPANPGSPGKWPLKQRERERETNTLPSCLLLIKGVSAQHYILSPTTKTQTSIILHWTALFRGQVNMAKAKCWPQAQSDVEAFITDLLGAGDKTSCRRATATIFPPPLYAARCNPAPAAQGTLHHEYSLSKGYDHGVVHINHAVTLNSQPKRPGDLDLESGVQVTCDAGYLCANFNLPRHLCSRLRPNVRDRRQTKASLNAPAY